MRLFSQRPYLLLVAGLACASSQSVLAASSTASADTPAEMDSLEEIVVTARRKEESAQTTPVSLSAFTAEAMRDQGITDISSLTAAVPGVNMTNSGGSNNTVFSIRGLSRGVVGNVQPAVTAYVNDVPLDIWGANIPTFDMAQVQVLKGPQGTLFGRNSVTGAVLANTAKPTYNLEGSLDITLGNYRWNKYDAVLNVPVLQDMLAVRVAAQLDRRDGYTKNLSFPGLDLDDRNARNIRVSVLFEPIEGLSNLTVFERDKADTNGTGIVPDRSTGSGAPDLFCAAGQFGFAPAAFTAYCNITRYVTSDKRAETIDIYPFQRNDLKSVTNSTSYSLGPVTLKNIFGYRTTYSENTANTDGIDLGLIDAHLIHHSKQITEEFQVSGSALDDNLTYIAGLFYLDVKPGGDNRLTIGFAQQPGVPYDAPPGFGAVDLTNFGFPPPPVGPSPLTYYTGGGFGSGDYYHDSSRAFYGQTSYKFGGISPALAPLSVDVGVRYTKDKESVCTAAFQAEAAPPLSENECVASGASSKSSAEYHKTTYNVGLNYQATDKVLIYGVYRTGYRGGGINTPEFGGNLVSFQNYKPDTVKDIELGLKSDWNIAGMQARFNLAVFQDKYKDLQTGILTGGVGDPDGDGNVANNPSNNTFYANAADATVKGIETDLTLVPVRNLELSFGGAWLRKTIDTVNVVLPSTLVGTTPTKEGIASLAFFASPNYSVNGGARYTLPLADTIGKVSASVRYFRISKVDYGSVHAPVGDKLDLRLDWRYVMASNVDLGLFVTNAQNRTYPITSASSNEGLSINSAIYNEPRMYGVQMRYSFGR